MRLCNAGVCRHSRANREGETPLLDFASQPFTMNNHLFEFVFLLRVTFPGASGLAPLLFDRYAAVALPKTAIRSLFKKPASIFKCPCILSEKS